MGTTSGRIYLHAGMPKTGTSYLQSIFHASRERLAREGLALAPPTRRENFWLSLAVRDALNARRDPDAALQIFDTFAAQVRTAEPAKLLVSDELLGGASSAQIERLLEACRPREVHLVLTVRSLARLLPSTWQQRIQQGGEAPSLDDFLDAVVSNDDGLGNRWWDERGVRNVVERWSSYVPWDRIHLVTVPSSPSPDELLRRYAEVLGVEASLLTTSAPRPNASLGYAEAELLRLVRERVPRELLNRHAYVPVGKRWLAQRHLSQLGGDPPRMPTRLSAWCGEEAQSTIDYLTSRPIDVVGDLEDLRPLPGDFSDAPPPSPDELVEVAVGALASIALERVEDDRRRASAGPDAAPGSPSRLRGAGRKLRLALSGTRRQRG